MPVNIDTFLKWGRTKRFEYLIEYARSIFLATLSEREMAYGVQGWLNLYDTQDEFQRGVAAFTHSDQKQKGLLPVTSGRVRTDKTPTDGNGS